MSEYDDFIKLMDSKIAVLGATAQKRLTKVLRTLLGGINPKAGISPENIAVLSSMNDQLKANMLAEDYEKIAEIYKDRITYLKDTFKELNGVDLTFTDFDKNTMQGILNTDLGKINNVIAVHGSDVKAAVIRRLYLDAKLDKDLLVDAFQSKIGNQIATEVRTGSMAMQQTVEGVKAKEIYGDDPLYLYMGPTDLSRQGYPPRDFCAERIGRVFTLKEINGMDNGQGLPAFEYRGGYNCRHHWRAISEDKAKADYGY